jgi:hypothetical protein
VLNGWKHTLDLGEDVSDGLNKIVLFYGNKIEPLTPLDKSRQNVRKGMVLVQSERNEISAESKYGSAL